MNESMLTSLFRLVSVGYAAENKALTSKELEIHMVEILPYLDGELTSDQGELSDSGVDGFGQKYTVKVSSSNCIKATWLQWGSNRTTAPDIRRGERVLVWQYADADKYYWTATGMDDYLRRLETAVFAFSATRKEDVKVLTPENSYYFEVNTHKKHVTFSTSKDDGEPFKYVFQFNTKEGCVTLADDDDNYVEFDSAERKITMKNKDTSFITIDKRVIRGFAPDLIQLKTKAYELHCDTVLENAVTSMTANTKQTTVNSSANISATTAAYTITSGTLQGNIGATTFTGTVTVQALLTAAGGFAAIPGGGGGGATATISIPMNVNADITSTGSVKNNGKEIGSAHQHSDPQGGTISGVI